MHLQKNDWNLQVLRDYIQANRGEREDLLYLVNAIGSSVAVFNYHLYTASEALKILSENDDATDLKHLKYLLGSTYNRNEYDSAKLSNQANVIAAIHTARSLIDVFSQLVRGCILEEMIEINECNIHLVRNKLAHGELKDCLVALLSSEEFKYVNDFANVSKHRSMIAFGTYVNFYGNRAGVRFCEFSYGKRNHPEMWSRDVLEMICKTKNTIIDAGNALNKELSSANV